MTTTAPLQRYALHIFIYFLEIFQCLFCRKLSAYPPIHIKREGLIGSTHAIPSRFMLDRPILITPQNEPLAKRLARILFEDGPIDALREAEQKTQGQKINYVFRGLFFAMTKLKQFNHMIWPYADNQNVDILSEYSQTR